MNELDDLYKLDEFDELDDFDEINPYLAQLHRKLSNIKLSYHILHLSPDEIDDIYEIKVFENPEDTFKFYISISEELMPKLLCTISGTVGNFSYSCIAPLTLRSLVDIADTEGELPARIKDIATKALAKKIHYDLPFNSGVHGYTI
jgi:hypothetical protein